MTVDAATRAAIEQTIAQYCWYIDEHQPGEWAALFVEDGAFEGASPDAVVGRAALEAFAEGVYQRTGGKTRHQAANLLLEEGETGNDVSARFYNLITYWDGENSRLRTMAISTMTLQRAGADAPWKIVRNHIRLIN